MPVTEADVAITERLSAHKPFRAVLKQSVDDFIVNEISQQHQVLRLTTLPRASPKRPRPPSPSPSSIPFSEIDQFFPSPDPPPSAALSAAISEASTSHAFPVLKDKHSRTKLHQWVRQYLPSFVGDTLQTDDGQVVRIRRRSDTRPWKRRRRDSDKNDQNGAQPQQDDTYDPREHHNQYENSFPRNSFVNFVLWKKNRDTTEALTMLGRALSRNVKHFFYAGTKDKRGVTTQLVQIRGVQEGDLARANSKLLQRDRNRASVLVGNVSLASTSKSSHLRLGDLKGNRFTLVLRDVEEGRDDSIQTASNSIREVGFINYFGLQRFGSGVSPTHVTGFAVLRGDFKEVCRRILLPLRIGQDDTKMNPGRKRFVQALDQFAEGEITACQLLSELAPWQRIERAIVDSFASDERRGVDVPDYRKAFGRLPRFLRMMYGHAVQSYLWNVMASERIGLSKPDSTNNKHAIEGDLIAEADVSEEELSFKTKVRPVTKEEEERKSISVHNVLIPVLGSEVQLPSVPYARKVKEIIEAEKLDFKTHAKSEYQVKGTYRRLLAVPKDFESKFVSYSDKRDIVVPSEVEALVAELNRKETTSHGNSTKKNEESMSKRVNCVSDPQGPNEGQKIQEKMDAEVINGEIGKDGGSPTVEHGEKRDGAPQEHEVGESQSKESSKEDAHDGKDSVAQEMELEAVESDAGQEHASESVDIPKESQKGVGDNPADGGISKDESAEQSKDEAIGLEEGEGTEATGKDEASGDVQIEDTAKDQKGDQAKENTEAIEAKDASINKSTDIGLVAKDEVDGQQGTGEAKENKDVSDGSGAVPVTQEVSEGEAIGSDAVRLVQNIEEQTVPGKVSKEQPDEKNVLVEDASHDKAEDASGNDVVPHQLPASMEVGGNINVESGYLSKSDRDEGNGEGKPRRALIISFSLGCAEYATMLVRELTGYESSTAAQKALQTSL